MSLDQLHSEIEALKTKSLAHEVSISELRRGSERTSETASGLRASIEALDAALQSTNKSLRAHEDNIVLLNETSDQHESALHTLGQGLRAVDASIRTADVNINTHASMLKTMESNFAEAVRRFECVCCSGIGS